MSFEYPIFQILLYIALFFAPPDTDRIFIGGDGGDLHALQRNDDAWELQMIPHGDSPAIPEGRVFIEGDAVLIKKGDAWETPRSLAEYVKLNRSHDWSRQPEMRLPRGSVLEKTSNGFLLRVADGTPAMKSYGISYQPRAHGKAPTIEVNVLGAVARPGSYALGVGANVEEAITAAGGLVGDAAWDTMRILRGSADAPQKVVQGLHSPLLDRDTLYVPARVAQAQGGNGGRPESDAIEAHLNRVSAMKHVLISARVFAEGHGGVWPGNLEAMREQLSGTPLGGADEDLARVGRLFLYRSPGSMYAASFGFGGAAAPRSPVLFELQPASGAQFVGFSDGSVTGFSDPERLRELGAPKPKGERLSFRWVGEDGRAPAEFLFFTDGPGGSPKGGEEKLSVFCEAVLTGEDVEGAERIVRPGQTIKDAGVDIKLTEEGGRKLAAATAANIGRRLAIVFDERVVSAPMVMSAITGGRVAISGRFTEAEVAELLAALNRSRMEDAPGIASPKTTAPEETIRFGGVEWLAWRTLFEVRAEEGLVSLPKVRPGFDYGHGGHGRGPEVITNIGNPEWRDYRIDADLLVPGVDPRLNPHGLGLDFHGAMIAFHVVDRKESFNESGTSAYILGFEGPGNWSLTAYRNSYCRQPQGWGSPGSDHERRLAGGSDEALDPVRGNRFRIEVVGKRIQIWIDGRKIVDVVDEEMGEVIGGRALDHGGVAFCGGFDAMIRLRSFEMTPLDATPARLRPRANVK